MIDDGDQKGRTESEHKGQKGRPESEQKGQKGRTESEHKGQKGRTESEQKGQKGRTECEQKDQKGRTQSEQKGPQDSTLRDITGEFQFDWINQKQNEISLDSPFHRPRQLDHSCANGLCVCRRVYMA